MADTDIEALMLSIMTASQKCKALVKRLTNPDIEQQKGMRDDLLELQQHIAGLEKKLVAMEGLTAGQPSDKVRVITEFDMTHVGVTERGLEIGGYVRDEKDDG